MSAAFAVGNLISTFNMGTEDAALTAELQAGSEEAFGYLIAQYQTSIYGLISRILTDPSDAADITQEVFVKVFRGIRKFNGESSLRTWIYRIALHEASNQRRWWSRHRGRELTIESTSAHAEDENALCLKDMLVDRHASPLELAVHEETRAKVELELRRLPEPFRTVVILRDLEGLPYDEIAKILDTQLGTVKSRLVRGRAMLRQRLACFAAGTQTHRVAASVPGASRRPSPRKPVSAAPEMQEEAG